MPGLDTPIRMLRDTPYGAKGSVNSTLDYGMKATLVDYQRAEWVQPEVVNTESSTASDSNRRTRKQFSDKGN